MFRRLIFDEQVGVISPEGNPLGIGQFKTNSIVFTNILFILKILNNFNHIQIQKEDTIMAGEIIIYIGSFLLFGWGTAHLFPTRNIVQNFGKISQDNKHIITMEWINEGITLIFLGLLIALVTIIERTGNTAKVTYWLSFGVLNILSIISLFTGFKNTFIVFKLCPFIFSGSSVLIIIGAFVL